MIFRRFMQECDILKTKKVYQIDENSIYVEDKIFHLNDDDAFEMPSGCVDSDLYPIPEGLYAPKFNGTGWESSLTQTEIDEIVNQPKEPSIDERMASAEGALIALMNMWPGGGGA